MCFSVGWIEDLLIELIILGGVFAILKLVIPYVLSQLGAGGGIIAAAINIVMWVIIAIIVVKICFGLISCLGGVHMGLLTH